MSKLEAGCKAFIINDHSIPENNWKIVELEILVEPDYCFYTNKFYFVVEKRMSRRIVPNQGLYWKVSGDLMTRKEISGELFPDDMRFYKPEQLMPLKGDFKLEQQTTENTLSCLSH